MSTPTSDSSKALPNTSSSQISTPSARIKTVPLPSLPQINGVSADTVIYGPPVPELTRLEIMSPKEWENFILEWAHSLKVEYRTVEKCAGAGDMGRDIVGYVDGSANSEWDNYQCKHYKEALTPSDIWCEIGKFCYYTYVSAYTVPRAYYFVAPRGVGNKLSTLLRSPGELKNELIRNWDEYCMGHITETKKIPLDAALKAHIEKLDFSNFRSKAPLTILDEHRKSPHHAARFGGGLRERPPVPLPPFDIADSETHYIRALLDAYEEKLSCELASAGELIDPALSEHFRRSRREFYSAEALREFSRDNVPPGTFEKLLDQVHDGVIDVVESCYPNGFERVLAVIKQAKVLAITQNALLPRVSPADRGGMCHELANEKRLKWCS